MRLRAAFMLLPLAATALLAAGCGDTVSLDPVARAADVTVKQTSEHMTMSATITSGTQTVTEAGTGDFQNNPNLGSLTLVATGAGRAITMNAVLDSTTVYMSSDAFANQLPNGKTWLKLDYGKTLSSLGLKTSALTSTSPSDALAQLQASGKVTDDGPATIDGVATTHYTTILDPSRAAAVEKATKVDVAYGPVEVWVDGQGLVRRMHTTSLEQASATVPQETTFSMTMTFSNYGEAVHAAVPPDSEVYDATGLATALLKK
ncbi:MAG TPA: LppX_LprAFG lipoprotein [Gaiellaceae bacterium]|nr:LppX_LprAFG lipoprotein [Gaiellaceae bacterium]